MTAGHDSTGSQIVRQFSEAPTTVHRHIGARRCLDDEFAEVSRLLLKQAADGQFNLLLSDLLAAELQQRRTK